MRKELDWKPTISFEEGLQRTVEWYRSHPDWVQRTKSGEYRDY
jgi:dTDP-glucose 4,6-dehydratase